MNRKSRDLVKVRIRVKVRARARARVRVSNRARARARARARVRLLECRTVGGWLRAYRPVPPRTPQRAPVRRNGCKGWFQG